MADPATLSPVGRIPTDPPGDAPSAGIGLCLSGGGFRAMLVHLGTLWRLNDAGYLRRLSRISSVSGGSITAARLGLVWSTLDFDDRGVAGRVGAEVVAPIRRFADQSFDVKPETEGGKRMRRQLLPVSLVGAVAAVFLLRAIPSSSTPADRHETPGPEECRVEPRSVGSMLQAYRSSGTPFAAPSPSPTPLPPNAPIPPLPGTAAEPTTVDQLRKVLREYAACYNARDVRRFAALFTDAGLARSFAGGRDEQRPSEQQLVDRLATPAPTPPDRLRHHVPAIREVVVMKDGRVETIVEDPDPVKIGGRQRLTRLLVIFVKVGDRWLIDDIVFLGTAWADQGGTPTGQ